MKIGIVCYASLGGSGVVATELALALAGRGHEVRVISSEPPFRWRGGVAHLHFDQVETPAYPLFREPQYLVTLASTIVRVAREHSLDVVHAHYAVPHATAAYLAARMLHSDDPSRTLPTVTTLHGTDITLVGADRSYRPVVAFSIEQSNAVTAVSDSLRRDTIVSLGIRRDIHVIPNFLDCGSYQRRREPSFVDRFCRYNGPVLMHMSNFRPVKRASIVFDIFQRVRAQVPSTLVFVGDGPERAEIEARAKASAYPDDVIFEGEHPDPAPLLSCADIFILPSALESFGMAALEAMACEVPVIASRVGGLPELIDDGNTGFLCELDDVDAMKERAIRLIRNPELARQMGRQAAASVAGRFCTDRIVSLYEAVYQRVVDARDSKR